MDIEEMHVTFRELAQQMGMQTVRAILSENIDICLNASIIDTAKELITASVGYLPNNAKVARHNAAVSPINGLRTLYKNATVFTPITGVGTEVEPYNFSIDSTNIMMYIGFKVSYDGKTLYDCRIVEAEDLGQTLRDFCNRAAKTTPICTISGDSEKITVDIITGRNANIKPTVIKYLYIAEPAKVYYDEEDSNNYVSCDLPAYLHMDIVRRAVSIYLQSVGAVKTNNKNND